MRITLLSAALLATGIASAATPVDGWYTSVFGGYTYIPSNINRFYYDRFYDGLGYQSGYNAGGRIGYQSNPIRYEAEYTYLTADIKHFHIDGRRQRHISGFSTANMLMANIYYDFPDMLPAISPYLGAGIGYSYLQVKLASHELFESSYFNVTDNAFAYQGTAGLTYNFAENYAANIAYRYVSTSKVGNFGTVFQAHIANVGVVYRFDHGNYK